MSKRECPGRRDFLKAAAAGAAGIALSANAAKLFAANPRPAAGTAPLNKWPGKVVINYNKKACAASLGGAPDTEAIKTMVTEAIKLFTGQPDVGAAWKAIFPSSGPKALSLTSKIAIKVPVGINHSLTAPHWASVQAITEGLLKMEFGGEKFKAANITMYDGAGSNNLSSCGFNETNFPGLAGFLHNSFGNNYTDGAEDNATPPKKQKYATALHDADFLINVFSPRGHSQYAERFTLGFKNHYGTYPCAYHQYPNTSQFLRNICCTGPVYEKTVLVMCSGIYGQHEGAGPTGSPSNYARWAKSVDAASDNLNPATIILGTDPVSVEMQTIKMMRIQGQGKYTAADMPDYLKASGGIVVSGVNWPPDPAKPGDMDNIGVLDEKNMTVLRIINGVPETTSAHEPPPARRAGAFVTASPLGGRDNVFIEFALPESHAGATASIEIYDLKGKTVRRLSRKALGARNQCSWDGRNASGGRVEPGTYIVRLFSGGIEVSSKFTLTK